MTAVMLRQPGFEIYLLPETSADFESGRWPKYLHPPPLHGIMIPPAILRWVEAWKPRGKSRSRPLVDRVADAYVQPPGVKAFAPVLPQVSNTRFQKGRHRLATGGRCRRLALRFERRRSRLRTRSYVIAAAVLSGCGQPTEAANLTADAQAIGQRSAPARFDVAGVHVGDPVDAAAVTLRRRGWVVDVQGRGWSFDDHVRRAQAQAAGRSV